MQKNKKEVREEHTHQELGMYQKSGLMKKTVCSGSWFTNTPPGPHFTHLWRFWSKHTKFFICYTEQSLTGPGTGFHDGSGFISPKLVF